MKRIAAIALALSALVAGPVLAEDYPSRPIRILVPYSPGGIADIAARILGAKLTRQSLKTGREPMASSP